VNSESSALLAGTRVLDLTTSRAELAGRLLADLGAEVLKIEPPPGAEARRIPPFDETAPERPSLYWAAVAIGKASAVLDLDHDEADRERLRQLAIRADVLIESFDPGTMAAWGLGYDQLCSRNPSLVYVSVSPYGQTGPKAHWPATELTVEAASGRLALQGDRDRPPLPIGYPQAAFHAGSQAAADAIIALNEREVSGRGQYLDVSMQTAMTWSLMNYMGYPALTGGDPPAQGDDRADPAAGPRGPILALIPCADGFVLASNTLHEQVARILPGAVLPDLARRGDPRPGLESVDWPAWLTAAQDGKADAEVLAAAYDAVRAFCLPMKKAEIFAWAWANDMRFAPVHTTRDLVDNPHFADRGFWQHVGPYLHPGPAARPGRTPLVLARPAPKLGANQDRIEAWLRDPPRPATAASPERPGEAFKGLKVADFSWVAIGPLTAKALADHGATVVRVESSTRLDYVRTLLPFKNNVPGVNRSHYMNNLNSSKLGVALNLRTEGGRDLARRLADWAEVVIEIYTPGTMQRLGLDYETLRKGHDDLIMVSTCLLGQDGPWSTFAGYGPHGAAIAGLYGITGWPDRAPCGPIGPYTDVVAPRYSVSTLAAALLERRRTGLGQHIDLSQVEAAIHFIEPLLLDETVNGRTAGAAGHDSHTCCPHGVYATAGIERYIAIAVETAAQWRALCSVAPLQDFAAPAFDAIESRRAAREAIDAALRPWVRQQDRFELERALVAAGVPAAVALRPSEVVVDPQLVARDYFVTLDHSEIGPTPFDGLVTSFSAKHVQLHKAAPCLGEDTEHVMRDILGLSEDQLAEHAANGVFT
jgi:crotonobetainyl-CoA:carnitine CoA-transferase CaiB-like acyl-CoA transferase